MPRVPNSALALWRRHWPEYAIEASLLGTFMVSACLFSVLLFYPQWPVARALPDPFARRVLMGLAMGSTAVLLNYSAWGKRSGAHYNPAVTLTFTRLGKVAPGDTAAYVTAQFVGGLCGVMAARFLAQAMLANDQVHFAVTKPGSHGVAAAFAAEVVISFVLMTVVLIATNHSKLARYTGLFAGMLVATFITIEAPVSGMSMNPARTMGSAFWAGDWTALWLYFTAPPLGMLLAAELYLRRRGPQGIFCAKLHHLNNQRCIFCEFQGRGSERREGEEKSVSGRNTVSGMFGGGQEERERGEKSVSVRWS
ncbi:MAG TPA: aquaporin [Gemmatimonadales bacterium]|nr:aquaporin [Gemmatimonadales bacterium]